MKIDARKTVLVAAIALGGCNREAKDFEAICHVVERSGVAPSMEPSQRAQQMSQWLERNVHSGRAKRVLAAIVHLPPDQKRAIVQREAAAAGYHGSCPLYGP